MIWFLTSVVIIGGAALVLLLTRSRWLPRFQKFKVLDRKENGFPAQIKGLGLWIGVVSLLVIFGILALKLNLGNLDFRVSPQVAVGIMSALVLGILIYVSVMAIRNKNRAAGKGASSGTSQTMPVISPWPRIVVFFLALILWGWAIAGWWVKFSTGAVWIWAVAMSIIWWWWHWSAQPGPGEVKPAPVRKSIPWPAVLAAMWLMVFFVGVTTLTRYLIDDQEWDAKVTSTVTNEVYPALDGPMRKIFGFSYMGMARDRQAGASRGFGSAVDIKPLPGNGREVTFVPNGEYIATGLNVPPGHVVVKQVPDSLYLIEAPGLRQGQMTTSGRFNGRLVMPSEINRSGFRDRVLRAKDPVGGLMLRVGDAVPRYVGSDKNAYIPTGHRGNRPLSVAVNLSNQPELVPSPGEVVVVRLWVVPRATAQSFLQQL